MKKVSCLLVVMVVTQKSCVELDISKNTIALKKGFFSVLLFRGTATCIYERTQFSKTTTTTQQ